jgi:hypothetical protein
MTSASLLLSRPRESVSTAVPMVGHSIQGVRYL